jgi:hypothetical protein
MQAKDVRALLGPDKIIGVTAKTVEQALLAQEMGADYLGTGAFFVTDTKKDALPITHEMARAITAAVDIPVTGIGGITPTTSPGPGETPPPEDKKPDEEPPLVELIKNIFTPAGSRGTPAWALVNLICLLLTIYLFVPLLHLKDKYGRIKQMEKFNEEKTELFDKPDLEEEEQKERTRILDTALAAKTWDDVRATLADITGEDFADAVEILYYHVTEFVKRFRLGFGLELVDVIAAIIAFILTEDMRLPMVLIDKWTPLMLILLVICWALDVRLMRYRDEAPAEEEEKAEEEKEAQPV